MWIAMVCCVGVCAGIVLGCNPKSTTTIAHVERPEPLLVPKGTPVVELKLPATVTVELSDGQREQQAVRWDTSQLPPTLQQEEVIQGEVTGGITVEITIRIEPRAEMIDGKPKLPNISAVNIDNNKAIGAMKAALNENEAVSLVTWAKNEQAVAFVFNNESLHIWKVGQVEPQEIERVNASCAGDIAWSYDDRFLWLDTGTSPARGCDIVDTRTAKHVAILEIAGHALWAPDRNVVLVGLFNRDVQLFWRSPEYGIDLAIFAAETRVLQRLASSTAEYEFVPVKWDGPERVLFRQRYFHNGREEEALVYYVGEVTENPLVPTLTAEELASSNLAEILSRKLQLAGLRAITWRRDRSAVAFLTATDCYVWQLHEADPRRLLGVRSGGFKQLHHLAWSPDGRYLSIHEQPGMKTHLKVYSLPECQVVLDLPVYTLAYWAPDSSLLLLATPSDVAPTIDFIPGYTADLVLFDLATGEKRILKQADGETSYRPAGWTGPNTVSYERIEGRWYKPGEELEISP